MSVSLPNGITLALATAYGSNISVSAVTNANPAVCTAAGHGLVNGDLVEFTSGWAKANNRIYRVSLASTTFALEGLDTSSTTLFPAGSGTGTVRKLTTLTQISQILDISSSGGDMQFANYSFLENDYETQLPTQASAQSITISVADDQTLAGYIALKAAAQTRALTGLKATLPNGSILLYNGYVSFDETPSMTKNQVMACKGTFSLQGRPVRY
jgi:hypothetical protein